MAHSIANGRAGAALLTFGAVWPILAVINTAAAIHNLPYYSPAWLVSIKAAVAGAAISAPELLVTGALLAALSLTIFTILDRRGWMAVGRLGVPGKYAEPCLLLASSYLGTGAWYPAALGQPILGDILLLPVWILVFFVASLGAVLARIAGRPGKRLRVFLLLSMVGTAMPLPSVIRNSVTGSGAPPQILILGLDSLSHDETAVARDWVESQAGTIYDKAVAPALLTNSVWASVLAADYPSRHGVTQTFEPIAPERSVLLHNAQIRGYRTVARFPDQLTCSAGNDAGFDENGSGPIGWRQLILPLVHNSSVFLPLVRPLLPRVRLLASPPNMAGTFSFSLEREIDELLHSTALGPTLVAGHLTYMHFAAYPRTTDLSRQQMGRLLVAQVTSLRDRTFDWKDSDRQTDPIPVHAWKRQRLLGAVVKALDRSGLAKGGSQIVLFSDHGERLGLNAFTVEDPKYHRVLLATVNVPPQSPEVPRSLVDIGFLLGLTAAHGDRPRVEFSVFPTELWRDLIATAQLQWSGRVVLDPKTTALSGPPIVFEPWK